jgi:hypothetical protein
LTSLIDQSITVSEMRESVALATLDGALERAAKAQGVEILG